MKKYYATFKNGIKIKIDEEHAKKILWLQKIIKEQREKKQNEKKQSEKEQSGEQKETFEEFCKHNIIIY